MQMREQTVKIKLESTIQALPTTDFGMSSGTSISLWISGKMLCPWYAKAMVIAALTT